MTLQKRAHAIVIGGSIAGLCAVRALADHFERVTLIERDRLPEGCAHRAGVPQAHHVHALLLRGLRELERLFPGIEVELTRAGATRVDLGGDVAHYTEWGWVPRVCIGVAPLTMSRLLLEGVIRARVFRDVHNLTRLEETRVTGIVIERVANGALVTGVSTSRAKLEADLVVDASGRNSRCLDWLEQQGVARPREDRVDPFAGYASRFYELAPDSARSWRGMMVDAKLPTLRRWGLLMPIEHGRVALTLAGINRDYPPGDEAGFQAFLDGLLSPALAREIARARPVSGIHTHRALSNRARRFDRWESKLAGFIALGDSAIAFNAAYGQGMSMAAVAVNTLRDMLARSPKLDAFALTRRFHKEQWKRLQIAWNVATGADLRWPDTEGVRPFGHAWSSVIGNAIVRAAKDDPGLRRSLGPVVQLLVQPTSLLASPHFLARVLRAEWRRRSGRTLRLPPLECDELSLR